MKPYRISKMHELKPTDLPQRLEFCKWAIGQIGRDDAFLDNLWFTDEAQFHVNGGVNTWNSRIWAKENPRERVAVGLHSPREGDGMGGHEPTRHHRPLFLRGRPKRKSSKLRRNA